MNFSDKDFNVDQLFSNNKGFNGEVDLNSLSGILKSQFEQKKTLSRTPEEEIMLLDELKPADPTEAVGFPTFEEMIEEIDAVSEDEFSDFKYSESTIVQELLKHCEDTYVKHYASKIEPVEFIFEKDLDVNFFTNSALTYLTRYGKKEGFKEADLFKAMHFCIIALHYTRVMKERGLINEVK